MIAEIVPITRLPLNLPFLDYTIPINFRGVIIPGQLVTIPFRKKTAFGIVLSLREESNIANAKLKEISSLVSTEPFISENLINFNREIADFYRASLGFVLKSALLPLQKRKILKAAEALVKMPAQKIQTPQKPTFIAYNSKEELAKNIEKICTSSGQRLILVPETYQIAQILELAAGATKDEPIIISGDMGEKEYFEKWLRVRNEADTLVIGTRKALWLPWINLSEIAVEDEGNSAYKSWDMAPRYHAREAAIMLAKYTGSKIFLMSAAPSVESYYFTQNKIYDGFTALKKISSPSPIFCDVRSESKGGNKLPICEEIIARLKNLNSLAFILVNRRGTAGTVLCRDCGLIFKCEQCGRPNAFYKKDNLISCHFCGIKRPLPLTCPSCNGANFHLCGIGTQGMAEAVKSIVKKDTDVIVIDSENTADLSKLSEIKNGVIIGTEYAWPYIDWVKTETIILADAESSLISAEFKATEDLWQTIRRIQLKARTEAAFYIQTSTIDHPVFSGIYEPAKFYETVLRERKLFGYPPYNYIIRLYLGSPFMQAGEKEAASTAATLISLTKKYPDVKILGPISAFPPFYRARYWQVIIVKLSYSNYKKRAKELLSSVSNEWKIDPNPNNLISIA
ncbi:MAG: primosomal protein N' [Candidatus Magasanikbacteria bacterium]|nr:primosomal protein N' [Candidatus Magasanikbacteria bacterium]